MSKKIIDMVYASPDQIREIKKEISGLERMLREDGRAKTPKIQDPGEVQQEIAKRKKLLVDHTPRKFAGPNANKAYAYAKRLRNLISEHMPVSRDFNMPYPKTGDGHDFDFERAVKQQIAFQTNPKLQKAVTAYKALMQRLDPQDSTVSNIEKLRR